MPAPKGTPPPAPTKAPAAPGAPPSPVDAPPAFEYTAGFDTLYLHVPLTARPADERGSATVFAWPDGAPADGRWRPTTSQPNQAPDNAGPQTVEE